MNSGIIDLYFWMRLVVVYNFKQNYYMILNYNLA